MKGAFIIFPLDVALYDYILALETFSVASEFDFNGGFLEAMLNVLRDILGSTKMLGFDQLVP